MATMLSLREAPAFQNILACPHVGALATVFKEAGFELRIAGGAVRDLLAGKEPHDLDFATAATPQQMKELFTKANVRMINELGEKHGTITARINDSVNFEVTTLRIDRVTDGRRAEVEFTTDWRLDANRRDLTVNAMFLDLDGNVYDFFGGKEDLEKRRVAFVGDARVRIQEDYLRILRYFRFYGRLAKTAEEHDEDTLEAIRENASGLEIVSGERIWMEWKKILSGNFAGELTAKMVELGLSPFIGLPHDANVSELETVWSRCQVARRSQRPGSTEWHPVTLLSALLHSEKDSLALNARLKMSGYERDLATFVVTHRDSKSPHPSDPIRNFRYLIVDAKGKPSDCRDWAGQTLRYRGEDKLAADIEAWSVPKFPVGGTDLLEAGCPKGKLMSVVLGKLREKWKEADFLATREDLLAAISALLDEIDPAQVSVSAGDQRLQGKKRKKST